MKVNPANWEAFVDESTGNWIRCKHGVYENVIWRPVDVQIGEEEEDGNSPMSFHVEFLESEKNPVPDDNDKNFEKVCGTIISEIIADIASKDGNAK